MPRSPRSKAVLAAATVAALTAAGLFSGLTAYADDVPTPDPTDTSVATPPADEGVDPVEPPAPLPPKELNPDSTLPTPIPLRNPAPAAGSTAGNSFGSPVKVTGYWWNQGFDNTSATTQSGEPRKLGGGYYLRRTQWIKWKAPDSGVISLAAYTADDNDDLGINVYTGSAFSNLHRVGTNDEQYFPVDGAGGSGSGPSSNSEILSLKVSKGKTYYIQVGSATSDSTDSNASTDPYTDITVEVVGSNYTPSNDNLSSASELKLGTGGFVEKTAILNGSTLEEWEPTDNDEDGTANRVNSVWYKWTAPQDGTADITTCAFFLYDSPTIAVFANYAGSTGNGYGDLSALDFDYDNNGLCHLLGTGGAVSVTVDKGVTYYLQVSSTAAASFKRDTFVAISFDASEPYIEKVSPSSGSHLGGNTITITGQEFTSGGAPTVKIGGHTATIVGIPSNTQIKVKAPAHAIGTVEVTVTSGGDKSNIKHYKYL